MTSKFKLVGRKLSTVNLRNFMAKLRNLIRNHRPWRNTSRRKEMISTVCLLLKRKHLGSWSMLSKTLKISRQGKDSLKLDYMLELCQLPNLLSLKSSLMIWMLSLSKISLKKKRKKPN